MGGGTVTGPTVPGILFPKLECSLTPPVNMTQSDKCILLRCSVGSDLVMTLCLMSDAWHINLLIYQLLNISYVPDNTLLIFLFAYKYYLLVSERTILAKYYCIF